MTAADHDALIAMLDRLKLTAIRDQLDTLLDEAARSDMTLRESWRSSSSARSPGVTSGALLGRGVAQTEPEPKDIVTGQLVANPGSVAFAADEAGGRDAADPMAD